MRTKLLGTLVALLTGTGIVLAETPLTEHEAVDVSVIQQAGFETAAPATAERVRSPYWSNVAALKDCQPGSQCPSAANMCAPGCPADEELFWADAEFLLWWVRKGPLPVPIVTTSSVGSLGILGQPDTAVLLGGNGIDFHAFSGGRFSLGTWVDRSRNLGIEGSGFFLEKRSNDFLAASGVNGAPLLARPYLNTLTSTESSVLVSGPGLFAGRVAALGYSGLYGWEVNGLHRWFSSPLLQIDLLAGFRYANLDEQFIVQQDSQVLAGGTASFAGNTLGTSAGLNIYDRFSTENEFTGGQFGARVEYRSQCWYVSLLGKIALGSTNQIVNITGVTRATTTPGGTASAAPNGVLALSTNSGRYSNDDFSFMPELGINVGWQINPILRVFGGYTLLYWTDIVRPGDQIDRNLNPSLIPSSQLFGTPNSSADPKPTGRQSDFWAQGLNFGLEVRY